MEITETDKLQSDQGTHFVEEKRDQWKRKLEYFMSIIGYMVSVGNLWRFPYLCLKNGGGAFLVPFVFCLIFLAFPMLFLEVSLGQFTSQSVVKCWEVCPLLKGIGFGMVFANALASYYATIVPWTLYYLGNSFITPLPWITCDNKWNSERCFSEYEFYSYINATNNSLLNSQGMDSDSRLNWVANKTVGTTVSSEEEFWNYQALKISSGIGDLGWPNVDMLLCLLIGFIIIYICLMRGIKSIAKAVYVTATLPCVLLVVLLVRTCWLPGAWDGILLYITPDFAKLIDVEVMTEAAIQVFYSASITYGPIITIASYNKFQNNSFRDAIIIMSVSEGTSLFAGFLVFAVLGSMANARGVPISEVAKSGPGLAYIVYPAAVSKLPLPNLWAVLFFLMVFTLVLDTVFGTVEPLITVFTDSFQYVRKRRMVFTAVIVGVYGLFVVPFCFQGGFYLFHLLDWFASSVCPPMFGLIECLIFGWIYGADNFSKDIQLMIGRSVPMFIRLLWCFLTPLLILLLLLYILTTYKMPTYGDYSYPAAANTCGIIIATIPVIPIPIVAFFEIKKAEGSSFIKKFRNAMMPSKLWGPRDIEIFEAYKEKVKERQHTAKSLRKTIKWNLFGK